MKKIEFEKKILKNILVSNKNIQSCLEGNIRTLFFQFDDTAKLFDIIMYHHRKYHKILQNDSLQMLLKLSRKMSDEKKKQITMLFEELKICTVVSNFELLLEEFRSYHEYNSLSVMFKKSMDDMADGDTKSVVRRIKKGVINLEQEVNATANDNGYFAADAEHMIENYEDRRDHPEKYAGIKIDIKELDDATDGFEGGTIVYLMGQMKSGKSVVMCNFAVNLANQGKRVYYHVNEGSKRMVINRMISCDTGIPYKLIKTATMGPQDEKIYRDYIKKQQEKNLVYVDRVSPSSSSVAYIENKLNELQTEGKFDILLIDMIPNMKTDDPEAKDWKRLGVIALELKDLAMKFNVPIIVLAHVNTEGMKSKKKNFELEHASVSKEPLKVVDLILSWRIDDTELESFKKTQKGLATLSVVGARDSAAPPEIPIYINTHIMKIDSSIIHK